MGHGHSHVQKPFAIRLSLAFYSKENERISVPIDAHIVPGNISESIHQLIEVFTTMKKVGLNEKVKTIEMSVFVPTEISDDLATRIQEIVENPWQENKELGKSLGQELKKLNLWEFCYTPKPELNRVFKLDVMMFNGKNKRAVESLINRLCMIADYPPNRTTYNFVM